MHQISLVAAYLAGMVALFAPCCISYLLPAYLGNIFKERKQVLFMTLVYSLGILVVLLPVVLGAKALASLFFDQCNLLERPLLKRKVTTVTLFGKTYFIFVANIIATAIFLITGTLMLYLNSIGRLGMSATEAAVAKSINNVAWSLTDTLSTIPGIDLIFTFLGAFLLYKFVQRVFKGKGN